MADLKRILIGGGTGFVGRNLCKYIKNKGHPVTIVSRMPAPGHLTWNELAKSGLPEDTKAVVNLAGQNVLDPTLRWTESFKQCVRNSRVNTTKQLSEAIIKAERKPDVFVSMSGVGYYKPSDKIEYTEESQGGDFDFLSKLAREWEGAAKLPQGISTRQVVIRSGVVLGKDGGMIKQLYVPFYMGVGGPVGSGKQYLPWIHVDDLSRLIYFAIENSSVNGVLNGVAPQQITNGQFSKAFGKAMWRPALFPVPTFVLNAVFSPERAKIMTEGQRVVPKKAQSLGFEFKYAEINDACKAIVNQYKFIVQILNCTSISVMFDVFYDKRIYTSFNYLQVIFETFFDTTNCSGDTAQNNELSLRSNTDMSVPKRAILFVLNALLYLLFTTNTC